MSKVSQDALSIKDYFNKSSDSFYYDKKIYENKYGYKKQKLLTPEEQAKREEAAKARKIRDRKSYQLSLSRTVPIKQALKAISRIKGIDIKFTPHNQISRVNASLVVAGRYEYSIIIDDHNDGGYSVYYSGEVDKRYNRYRSSYDRYADYEGGRKTLSEALKSLTMILHKHYPHHDHNVKKAIAKSLRAVGTKPVKSKVALR